MLQPMAQDLLNTWSFLPIPSPLSSPSLRGLSLVRDLESITGIEQGKTSPDFTAEMRNSSNFAMGASPLVTNQPWSALNFDIYHRLSSARRSRLHKCTAEMVVATPYGLHNLAALRHQTVLLDIVQSQPSNHGCDISMCRLGNFFDPLSPACGF